MIFIEQLGSMLFVLGFFGVEFVNSFVFSFAIMFIMVKHKDKIFN